MPLKRETTRPAFLLNSVDRHGRPIDPGVLSVAQEISQQALAFAERIIGDPAVVQNLFEEAAAAVSEAAETKHASDKPPIKDLRAYLFRTVARRIAREKRKEAALRNEINLNVSRTVPKLCQNPIQLRCRDLLRARSRFPEIVRNTRK